MPARSSLLVNDEAMAAKQYKDKRLNFKESLVVLENPTFDMGFRERYAVGGMHPTYEIMGKKKM